MSFSINCSSVSSLGVADRIILGLKRRVAMAYELLHLGCSPGGAVSPQHTSKRIMYFLFGVILD